MRKSVLMIASLCLVALGVLGYSLLYAGSTGSAENRDKECAATCEEAHAGAYRDAASGECPYSARKAADKCCASMNAAKSTGTSDACKERAKACASKSKEECMKEYTETEASTGPEKIDIK